MVTMTLDPITELILGLWGDIKTCKSTLSLTFPKPLFHLDFDLGFQRAKPTIPPGVTVLEVPWGTRLTASMLSQADIVTKTYRIPIRFPKQPIRGVLELWEGEVMPDIIMAMEAPHIKSIVYDTGTVMWRLATDAHLQRAQTGSSATRTSLIQIEYAQPNQESRAVISAPRHYGKNLCITHHIGGKYENRISAKSSTGYESVRIGDTWDGWNHLGAIADVIVKTYIQETVVVGGVTKAPAARIETCGYTLAAEGLDLVTPSFDMILNIINQLRGQPIT